MNVEKKKEYEICIECKNRFIIKRKWQKYCSPRCRWKQWDKKNPRSKQNGRTFVAGAENGTFAQYQNKGERYV